jgi:MoaA/NifB/PqqE/SkfB family radical SAM enzyme
MELTIEVTNNCGNRCVHCSSCALYEYDLQGEDSARGKNEQIFSLTKPDVVKVLDENPQFDKVRFSGGEPFMHPLLLEFLREAKKRTKTTEVLSSGVYYRDRHLPSLLTLCGKSLIDKIGFSIYGSKETHNEITQNEFSFDSLQETLQETIEERIPFSFNFVCMKKNISQLENVFEYANNWRIGTFVPRINFLRLIKQGNCEVSDSLALDKSQITGLINKASTLAEKYSVPILFGCSLAETSCNAGKGKRVFTYKKEYIDCSALKYGETSFNVSRFRCAERW